MKYESRADLLIAAGESIKMQENAGIDPVCKINGEIHITGNADSSQYCSFRKLIQDWEFPLAVVEGKPVFVGDVLYYEDGVAWYPNTSNQIFDGSSWNPPKLKTVMVELLREDAEYWDSYDIEYAHMGCAPSKYKTASENFYKSVRKALEQA